MPASRAASSTRNFWTVSNIKINAAPLLLKGTLMTLPENVKYTKDHEWIRIDGTVGVIGITDYAQGELGDIVFVEVPPIGRKVEAGQVFGTVEAVKAVSDLYSPITGEVVDVNKEIQDSPELVNKEPYERGWMIKVKIENEAELASLLDLAAYKNLIAR
jgi:glycine cleavage system H protein